MAQYSLAKGHWLFDPAVLVWGTQFQADLQPDRLLIENELGPLDLLDNLGLTTGIAKIDRRGFNFTYVVIRLTLMQNARQRHILLGFVMAIPGLVGLTFGMSLWLLFVSAFAMGFFLVSMMLIM